MKWLIFLVYFISLASVSYSQTKSITGTVVDYWVNNKGTSESITVKVGSNEYTAYITRPDLRQPRIIGNVNQVGKTVRIYYTSVVNGELKATKIEEVKKPSAVATSSISNVCRFCGTWKFYNRDAQSNQYLRLSNVGSGRYRLSEGSIGMNNQIYWPDDPGGGLDISNADAIYLRMAGEKLSGSFRSRNFRATSGSERTYQISCEMLPSGKMRYLVKSSGFTETYTATKQN